MLAATGGGTPAGQHQLEVSPRQPVLFLEEERARQFQAHPDQLRTVDQDGAEGLGGLVIEFAALGVAVGLLGQLKRRQAQFEQPGGGLVRCAARLFLGGGRRQHQARQEGGQ